MKFKKQFLIACQQGNLSEAQKILQIASFINISEKSDRAFRHACYQGHLHIAKWLISLNLHPAINVSAIKDYAFRHACNNGHLQLAQWLLQIKPDIDLTAHGQCSFNDVCSNGHLPVAQWLYEIMPTININRAFEFSCNNSQIHIAMWLHSLSDSNIISLDSYNNAFFWACHHSHVCIAKWLLQVCESIDIVSVYNQLLMRSGLHYSYYYSKCKSKLRNIAIMYFEINPFKYEHNIVGDTLVSNAVRDELNTVLLALLYMFSAKQYCNINIINVADALTKLCGFN
jgi:hypothetical protein